MAGPIQSEINSAIGSVSQMAGLAKVKKSIDTGAKQITTNVSNSISQTNNRLLEMQKQLPTMISERLKTLYGKPNVVKRNTIKPDDIGGFKDLSVEEQRDVLIKIRNDWAHNPRAWERGYLEVGNGRISVSDLFEAIVDRDKVIEDQYIPNDADLEYNQKYQYYDFTADSGDKK